MAHLGDARVALIGFPSVGKSTIFVTLTKTESEAAAYECTLLTCVPGTVHYNKEVKFKFWICLELSKEGTSRGMGRGKEVIAVACSADTILMYWVQERKVLIGIVKF